jgi:hypothetical protein
MQKPEGWTSFWRSESGPQPVVTQPSSPPQAEINSPIGTATLFLQRSIKLSRRMWLLVVTFVLAIFAWRQIANVSSTAPLASIAAAPSGAVVPSPATAPDAGTRPDVGSPPQRRADAGAPLAPSAPVRRAVLRLRTERLRISGLDGPGLQADSGSFRGRGDGLTVIGQWRRNGDAIAVSLSTDPWTIVYRQGGPAIGRTPPQRHLALPPGSNKQLRLSHPTLGDFRLHFSVAP